MSIVVESIAWDFRSMFICSINSNDMNISQKPFAPGLLFYTQAFVKIIRLYLLGGSKLVCVLCL